MGGEGRSLADLSCHSSIDLSGAQTIYTKRKAAPWSVRYYWTGLQRVCSEYWTIVNCWGVSNLPAEFPHLEFVITV